MKPFALYITMPDERPNINEHLANERTFLAWIRTSIGIMGFGFVVVKFSIFIRQITFALEKVPKQQQSTGYSPYVGIMLVALGTIAIIFSYLRYMKTKKQLDTGTFRQSTLLIQIITILIFLGSLVLIAYLSRSI